MKRERAITRAWRGEAKALSAALVPVSWAYRAGAWVHRTSWKLRAPEHLPVPVISIGNLVVGGAGKTPVTLELARRFLAAGRKVAVLSRGYGRSSTARAVVVSDGIAVRATADEGGDEPVWLARKVPGLIVAVAAQRRDGAAAAMDLGADLLLLDDGFSHYALPRDADVIVIDDQLKLGNGRLLPAGPLRVTAAAAKDAALLWLTRCESVDAQGPASLQSLPTVRSRYDAQRFVDLELKELGPADLQGKRVVATCGIARPSSFEKTLEALGANVRELLAFPDHHRFTPADVEKIESVARGERCEVIVTTEKDAVRLAPLAHDERWRALAMELSMLGDVSPLDALVRRFSPGLASGEAA